MTHDPMCPSRDLRYDYSRTELRATSIGGVGLSKPCRCKEYAKVRADERSRIADAVAELMIAHPYEYPSDYAEADREWIRAGCPRDAINALKEKP